MDRAGQRESSDDIQVNILVHCHLFKLLLIERHLEDGRLLPGGEAPRKVGAELVLQQRNAVLAPPPVPDSGTSVGVRLPLDTVIARDTSAPLCGRCRRCAENWSG